MSLDFQQIHEQVRQLGENAPLSERRLQALRQRAGDLLLDNARELERLRNKVGMIVKNYDSTLRCALPLDEPLDSHYPLPPLPSQAILIAADGSQINPDRHAAVNYCLINVGAIQMRYGVTASPQPFIRSELLYDDKLYTSSGTLTDSAVALMRDLNERRYLAELVAQALAETPSTPPVITFTDGPMELWGAKDEDGETEFQKSLKDYLEALSKLRDLGVATAGYVDKPGADLVVRLLEVAETPADKLPDIRKERPLRGVTDTDLYRDLLAAGERSAVFAMQSKSAENYTGDLALRFFYLNVGLPNSPWLARVETPDWVADDPRKLNNLHAVLIHQCKIMGARAYPYLLHRAHETAVVTLDEKEQLTQMIVHELRRRGVPVGSESHKQAAKDVGKRTRFKGGR